MILTTQTVDLCYNTFHSIAIYYITYHSHTVFYNTYHSHTICYDTYHSHTVCYITYHLNTVCYDTCHSNTACYDTYHSPKVYYDSLCILLDTERVYRVYCDTYNSHTVYCVFSWTLDVFPHGQLLLCTIHCSQDWNLFLLITTKHEYLKNIFVIQKKKATLGFICASETISEIFCTKVAFKIQQKTKLTPVGIELTTHYHWFRSLILMQLC